MARTAPKNNEHGGIHGLDPSARTGAGSAVNPLEAAEKLHQQVRDAVARERQALRDVARAMAQMSGTQLFRKLGYASMAQYGEVEFGMKPHKVYDLVTLGRRLRVLGGLSGAMERGELGWTKALMVARIADRQTDGAWVAAALENTSRELELMTARSRKGDMPPRRDESLRAPAWMNVSFRMETRHYEQLTRAFARIRRQNGGCELSGGQLLAAMAEKVITGSPPGGGEAPNGARENYRMVVHQCPDCRDTWQETAAGRAELTDAAVEMVECDAERVQGDDAGKVKRGTVQRTIPPTVRRAVMARDEHRCSAPGCCNDLWLDLHHVKAFASGGAHVAENLVTCCSTHHDLLHQGVLRVARGDDGEPAWTRPDGQPFGVQEIDASTTHVSSDGTDAHDSLDPM